ncbi:Cytochrome P450 [Rhynchospora pubera]|uniref:Cytochrome P450 n=2 Tax=Rhynchospora pubera TaxID=906938 RepID=A0AAV8C0Y9_9POAL|nr:Cytochrome P450 [Rhynchospora pubera]
MIGFVLSGYETTSTVLMLAIKYLHDHPHAQDELRKENLEIRKGKPEDYTINWDDYKSMSFTRAVVLETLRMSALGLGLLRRTTADTEIKGYIIPKGWTIFVCTMETIKDPDTYPEPLKFNPWRWPKSNLESHQYFMLFGGGARLCPGKELGILEVSMFLHYLVTRYRWEEVGENKIVSFPKVEAPNGLYYRLRNC